MKKAYIILPLAAIVLVVSCSKFDDYNTNPNTTTVVTADMLATGAMLASFPSRVYASDAKAYIGMNALPKYVAYLGEAAYEPQYNSVGSCTFSTYTTLPNLEEMKGFAAGGLYEASYSGLALFLKAFNAYKTTMMAGDVPYSEAGQGEHGTQSPVYDPQQQVLEAILADLQAAEAQFAAGRNFGGDIIYGGDVARWRKACNAMQLKVLLSMSKKITADQKARFGAIVSAGNLMTANADNLCVTYAADATRQHPLYNQMMFAPRATLTSVVVDALKELNDYRLFYFAEPAAALITAGGTVDDPAAYIGCDPSEEYSALAQGHANGEYSIINNRYLTKQAGDPYIHLTYAGQCFAIAEAIELGWLAGNSQTYYENGVKAALEMVASWDNGTTNHGMTIDATYISGYFTGEAAYRSASEDRLKQIRMQRYLLGFMQDGTDSYFDFRRTGYPEFPVNAATSMNEEGFKNAFPQRWRYPGDEVQTNKENLNTALGRQFSNGYDGINEKMWLLKD